MILIGNQRGGGRDLAAHLLSGENDHVTVHEVRGFASDDVQGAFQEAYALSKGTRCKQAYATVAAHRRDHAPEPEPQHEASLTDAYHNAL